ncbi:uncharacterized protein LOC116118185 [Pistacia vera]|uniref:uncharacterized protein LOC116118185 n=1 Tax=Pistacia vera TaxID=55513 RepID=UPI0012633418|nr:uncharacterized protein LOC116118185 [Pistacia vera]
MQYREIADFWSCSFLPFPGDFHMAGFGAWPNKGFRRALFPDAAAENCIFPVPRSLFGAAAAEFWSSLELQQQICGSFRGVWLVVQGFVKQFGCFVQCVLQLQLQCCILLAIIHPV